MQPAIRSGAEPSDQLGQQTRRRRRISATMLAQYVRFGNCDRLLYLTLFPHQAAALEERWRIAPQPLTPLLRASGESYERDTVDRIARGGAPVVDLTGQNDAATLDLLRRAAAGQRVVLCQATLSGQIGQWPCGGNADLIWLTPDPQQDHAGQRPVSAVVVDVKASLEERVEHRLQVAFYVRLLRQIAGRAGIALGAVDGAVLHRGDGDALEAITADSLAPFDHAPYDLALDHLLGDGGALERVARQPFEEVHFCLSFKCDGCLFNAHCMHDSAGRERVALVPYLTGAEQRLLQRDGIGTFRDLAGLTTAAAPGQYRGPLAAAPGQEARLARLRSQWQLQGLDRHTQRARALVRARDGVSSGFEPVIDGGFGTLPADDAHPGLVKVFFDVQHDFVRDAVYLLAALVRGPRGQRIVLERTAAPPDREAECTALARWVAQVYAAVRGAAAGTEACLHLYAFSRHDQSVLLAALRRHLGGLPLVAALFDLLTDTPALSPVSPLAQPMVSFLADEVRDRMTLDLTCTSLQEVATRLGFDWTGPTPQGRPVDFRRQFRARLFDSRRQVELPDPGSGAGRQVRRVWIACAARFRSQIPLEYAYGAWDALPAPQDDLQRRLLQPFQGMSWDALEGLAQQRVYALAHVESAFRLKSTYAEKRPIPLPTLVLDAGPDTLPRALEDFLLVEHHTGVQELFLHYARPVEQRAQTGRGALLQCLRFEKITSGSARAVCRVAFDDLGLEPALAEPALRLKEGDWVVVNPVAEDLSPARMLHGRLATIERLARDDGGQLVMELELNSVSAKRVFSYWHRTRDEPTPGDYYTVDEMADDLNGDKLLAACRAAGNARLTPNPLLAWLVRAADGAARCRRRRRRRRRGGVCTPSDAGRPGRPRAGVPGDHPGGRARARAGRADGGAGAGHLLL